MASLTARGSSALIWMCKRSACTSTMNWGLTTSFGPSNKPAASKTSFPLTSSARYFATQKTAEDPDVSDSSDIPTAKAGTSPAVGKLEDVSNLDRLEKCVNAVQLIGRVGSDPQLRGTEANPVLLFSLATHEGFRDATGALQQKTTWHRVAIFRPGLRETAFRYLRKGQRAYVTGAISYGNVKDPETNIVRTSTTIVADELIVLGGPAAKAAAEK